MKSVLITTFVFGRDYCSYIVPYIYCAKKTYPEYDILIYVDTNDNIALIEPQLKKLTSVGITGYKIRQIEMPKGLSAEALSDKNVNMAVRWLHWSEEYWNYEGVYIGDIDLFICKEDIPLFEQHEIHCQTLGLPISNITRVYNRKLSLRQVGSMAKKWGIVRAIKDINKKLTGIPRLTGLHYFKPNICGRYILEALPKELEVINSIYNGKNPEYGVYSALDEFFLYDLYNRAGYHLPKPVTLSALDLMGRNDPTESVFRPHHGVHLGMWRRGDNKEVLSFESNALACSEIYLKYKEQILSLYNSDPIFRDILEDNTSFAGRVIGNMIRYYKKEA